jgi:hypothetical protein
MTDALWVQASGVSYTAEEDRKLINAIFTDGVVRGLELSNGGGLNVNIAAGAATIADGDGGSYLAVLDSTTSALVSANTTASVYMQVNETTGVVSLTAGSTPTNPYITIGSATTNASAITSVSYSARATAAFRASGSSSASYVSRSGDVMTGSLTAPTLIGYGSGTFMASSAGVYAQQGIRVGSQSYTTKRAFLEAMQTTVQSVPANIWTTINFNAVTRETNDYGTPYANSSTAPLGSYWRMPVAGMYSISGLVGFITYPSSSTSLLVRVTGFNTNYCGVTNYNLEGEAYSNCVPFNTTAYFPAGALMNVQAFHANAAAMSTAAAYTSKPTLQVSLIEAY